MSFCRRQLPQKSINLSFTIPNMRIELTDLWGNWPWKMTLKTLCLRQALPLSSQFGTIKTFKARFWPLIDPFFRQKFYLKAFEVFFFALEWTIRRLKLEISGTAVERIWHTEDSQRQILALAFKGRPWKRVEFFPPRSRSATRAPTMERHHKPCHKQRLNPQSEHSPGTWHKTRQKGGVGATSRKKSTGMTRGGEGLEDVLP